MSLRLPLLEPALRAPLHVCTFACALFYPRVIGFACCTIPPGVQQARCCTQVQSSDSSKTLDRDSITSRNDDTHIQCLSVVG